MREQREGAVVKAVGSRAVAVAVVWGSPSCVWTSGQISLHVLTFNFSQQTSSHTVLKSPIHLKLLN